MAACLALLGVPVALAQAIMPSAWDGHAPEWTHLIRLSDGRTFVSDGRLLLDTTLARPSTLPTTVIAEGAAAGIERYLAAKHTASATLAQLTPGAAAHTYVAPSGMVLNATYVRYLQATVPEAWLKTKGDLDPIVVMHDGRAVGLLMAVKR